MNLYRLFPPTKTDESPPDAIWFRKKVKAVRTYNEWVRRVNGQPHNYSDKTVSLEIVSSKFTPATVLPYILNGEEWIHEAKVMHSHAVPEW